MPRPVKAASPKPKAKPPYPFVLEALEPLHPEVRRMFSGFAVYIADLLVLMLRDSAKQPEDNGLWLVLAEGVDPVTPTLRRDFPSLRRIQLLGNAITHWLLIPADSQPDGPDFESQALHACDLIARRDPRIGRIPQSRR